MGKSTATAVAILQAEKAAFDTVHKHPLTRILGWPTRTQQDKLVEEISNLALECNVTYKWAGDYGLLVEIMGNGAYLLLTGKEYTKPTKPPKYQDNLNYYSGIVPSEQNDRIVDIVTNLERYRSLLFVMKEKEDIEFYEKNKKIFNGYNKRFERFNRKDE